MKESFILDLGKEERVIRGDIYLEEPLNPKPVILLLHGFKGFKDWCFFPMVAQRLANHGFAVIAFNFSMNGMGEDSETYTELEKFGRLTYSREQEDISFLLTHLKNGTLPYSEYMDIERIGLFGHSRGGGNSLLFALDHPEINSVVVWNSIFCVNFFDPALTEEIQKNGVGYITHARTGQQMPITREVLEDMEIHQERFDILGRLPELHCPVLIVQGDQDHPYLVEGAPLMADKAPHATLCMIDGADHTMNMKHPSPPCSSYFEEACVKTLQFFTQHINKEEPSLS